MNMEKECARYSLRIERELLRRIEKYAKEDRRSINQWLVILIEKQLEHLEGDKPGLLD